MAAKTSWHKCVTLCIRIWKLGALVSKKRKKMSQSRIWSGRHFVHEWTSLKLQVVIIVKIKDKYCKYDYTCTQRTVKIEKAGSIGYWLWVKSFTIPFPVANVPRTLYVDFLIMCMEEFHERSRMGKMCRNVWSRLNPAKNNSDMMISIHRYQWEPVAVKKNKS